MNAEMHMSRRPAANPNAPAEFYVILEQFGQTITIPERDIHEFALRAVNIHRSVQQQRGALP